MLRRVAQVVPGVLVVGALTVGAIAPAMATETDSGTAVVAPASVDPVATTSDEPTRSTRTVEETVTVTFKGNGASSDPSVKTLFAGQSFDDAGLEVPMWWRTGGYVFTSWNTAADGSGTTLTASTVITADMTVYAQWYLRPGVDVFFDGNGGTSPKSIGLYEDQTVTIGGKTLPTSTRTGYTFVGWNTARDGSGTTFTADTPVHVTLTVYAQWLSYPVTFDGNGVANVSTVNVFAGKSLTDAGHSLPTLMRRGYTFAGWNTAANGTGSAFTTSTAVSGAMTVFAQWTANDAVTVSFYGNGGDGHGTSTVLSGQSFADAGLALPEPARAGFTFDGWNTAADGTGSAFTTDTVVDTSLTVYAQWVEVPTTPGDGDEGNSEPGTEPEPGTETEPGSESGSESGVGEETGTGTEPGTETGTESGSEIGTETETGTVTENGTEAQGSTGSDSAAVVSTNVVSAPVVTVPVAEVVEVDEETGREGSAPASNDSRIVDFTNPQMIWRQNSAGRWVQMVRVGKPGAYRFVAAKKSVAVPTGAVFAVITSGDAVKAPSKNKAKAKAQVQALADMYDGTVAPALAGGAWRGNARVVAVW